MGSVMVGYLYIRDEENGERRAKNGGILKETPRSLQESPPTSLQDRYITVLVSSPAGGPYIHGDPSFDATVDRYLSSVQEPNGSETNKLRLWLEFLQVEAYDRVDDQLALKKELEDISGMLDEFVKPFLV
ncbi:hypothetical protein F0562_010581 [Nyssa sinensis]|uniref:Uncharacterized protein n=1 Tax=Nyssa sinensis TaxID=561372 RepID=A0A5J5A1X2_9ASTE|nr:hypothetical protein F0562_010581 [Nyssa sinensis]